MPDTVLGGYSCPCGWVGNSRQALHWHKNNSCKLNTAPQAPQEPAKAALVAKVEQIEPSTVEQEKPQKTTVAPASRVTQKLEPEPEPEDEPEEIEEEPDEKDAFDVLLLPLIIVVLLVAGLFVFREKIAEIFERMKGGMPPAYGVPAYG